MKKHKSSKPDQASTSNGAAEVFVLTPEILAKLGINLGNIQNAQPSQTNHLVEDTEKKVISNSNCLPEKDNNVENIPHILPGNERNNESFSNGFINSDSVSNCQIDENDITNSLQENTDASSIIETANLMKESVFLSPTFFHIAPTVPENEEPMDIDESIITSNTIISSESDTMSQDYNKNSLNSVGVHNTPQLVDNIVVLSPNTDLPEIVNNNEVFNSIQDHITENQCGDLVSVNVLSSMTTNKNKKTSDNKSNTTNTVDEQPDEAYLSDCSNSYSGCSPEIVKSEVSKQNKTLIIKSTDLSDAVFVNHSQVIDVSAMDVICSISESVVIPVTTNSIVMQSGDNSDLPVTNKAPEFFAAVKSVIPKSTKHATNSEIDYDFLENKQKENQTGNIDVDHTMPSLFSTQTNDSINKDIGSEGTHYVLSECTLLSDKKDTKDPPEERKEIVDTQISELNKNSKILSVETVISDSYPKNTDVETFDTKIDSLNIIETADPKIYDQKRQTINCVSIIQDSPKHNKITDLEIKEKERQKQKKSTTTRNNNQTNDVKIKEKQKQHKQVDGSIANKPVCQNNNIKIIEKELQKHENVVRNQDSRKNNKEPDLTIKGKEKQNEKSMVDTQDKVKEIAEYLSKIANERKNKRNNDKINIANEAKSDIITSKLCIQGVEKPGGNIIRSENWKCLPVTKTYQRVNIKKQIPKTIEFCEVVTSDSFQITECNTPVDGNKITPLIHQNDFCICYDFGSLAYYDCEMLFEHIHFWSHKNIDCDSETLYSIYNEDYTVLKQSVDFIEDAPQLEHGNTTIIQDTLCWKEMKLSREEDNEFEVSTKTDTTKGHKAAKKRDSEKPPIATNEAKDPKVKDKCGVSNEMVLKDEKEAHKEKGHHFVAHKRNKKQSKTNSNKITEASPSSKSSQKSEGKQKKTALLLPGTEIKNKKDEKESVTPTTTSIKTIKLSEKADITALKPLKSTKNTSEKTSENVASLSSETIKGKTKKQSNKLEIDVIDNSRPKRKSSLNTISNTAEIPTKSKVTDGSKKEQTVSANVSTDTVAITSRTSKRLTQAHSNTSESFGKSAGNSTEKHNETPIGTKLSKAKKTFLEEEEKSGNLSTSVVHKTPNTDRRHSKTKNDTLESTDKSPTNNIIHTPVTRKKSLNDTQEISDNSEKSSDKSKINKPLTRKNSVNATQEVSDKSEKSSDNSKINKPLTRKKSLNTTQEVSDNLEKSSEKSKINKPLTRKNSVNATQEVSDKSEKSSDNSKITKLLTRKKIINPTQEVSDNSTGFNTPKKLTENLDKKASKSESKSHSNSGTTRATKRSSSTVVDTIDTNLVKKIKITESLPTSKISENISEKKSTATRSTCTEQSKGKKKLNSTETHVSPRHTVSRESEMLEDSTKVYEVPIEESTIPDDSIATTMNNSTLSSNTVTNESQNTEYYLVLAPIESDDLIKCGVCDKIVEKTEWLDHISKTHDYIAWRDGETPLDLDDEIGLKKHIQSIANEQGKLVCSKCGLVRKVAKVFLRHIRSCTGPDEKDGNSSEEDSLPLAKRSRNGRENPGPVTCGVCNESVEQSQWIEHLQQTHKYLAWTTNELPVNLNNPEKVKAHLKNISKMHGGLKCHLCPKILKSAKNYQNHMSRCGQGNVPEEEEHVQEEPVQQEYTPRSIVVIEGPFTCGVCSETVERTDWIEHIRRAHKYLAWTYGEPPLDVNNPEDVKEHLKYISKNYGGLACGHCGVRINYVKIYLNHINECSDAPVNRGPVRRRTSLVLPPIVTCGVCKLDVQGKLWIQHIQVAHDYMAWVGGETPLDPNDPEMVKDHLDVVVRAAGELVCRKCSESRRNVRSYLQHVAACAKTGFKMEIEETEQHDASEFVCGVCRQTGDIVDWSSHAMKMHYNVAWKAGEVPINLRSFYAVEKYLKLYRRKHGLVCRVCKASRASCYGFYAHIIACGKTEEELDAFNDLCEVCNKKYLCVYRNQHMAAHRDSDMRRERREKMEEIARLDQEEEVEAPAEDETPPSGKRRAAERAKKIIQKHSVNMVDGVPVCGCGTSFKNLEAYSEHSCPNKQNVEDSDSDVSVKLENESEESADEAVDSGVSEEEEEREKKMKRVRVGEGSTKIHRMPYKITNFTGYLQNAYKDFAKLHYTTSRLFDSWRDSEIQTVPPDHREKYLPQVMNSCKVRFGDRKAPDAWITYKRFETRRIKMSPRGYSLYGGGAIQCLAWAPHNMADESLGNYLAVVAHRAPDTPRLAATDRVRHPAALQIWRLGQFDILPRCVVCIAHEYGVVWAMDWCPSGARDASVSPASPGDSNPRLGLLAIACSNGSAYILAVPTPPALEDDEQEPVMYKLKPVAELRLTMTSERRIYQATSINWSPQKEHSTIIVGYSDGTTALYDLNTASPFLTSMEKGVAVYYPFQDRRAESTAVTGVGVFATANGSLALGGQFSASSTGGSLLGAAARPAARAHPAAAAALAAAHWPAVLLAGDLPFMRAASGLEWWGGARRVGTARAWAACARCGRAASAAPSALRSHRNHPVYPDPKKLLVATLEMVPLSGQKRKQKNDDLSVVVEPLCYDDAAAKYGLHFTLVTKTSRSEQFNAQQIINDDKFRPERFPLSDIVALAFCPAARFHDRIAFATHTGLIFIINI